MDFMPVLRRYCRSFSLIGLFVAALFFYASLTPSLIPRSSLHQGVLSGLALAIGYGIGVSLAWLWRYLELPQLRKAYRVRAMRAIMACSIVLVVFPLLRATAWQNSIRRAMGLEDISGGHQFLVVVLAVAIAVLIISIVRLLLRASRFVSHKLSRVIPRRVANVIGVVVVGLLVFLLVNNVFISAYLRAIDSTYAEIDLLTGEEFEQPANALRTGSPSSLIAWDTLSVKGKNFTSIGPTQEEISEFSGKDAKQPLRVYVGLRSAETVEERAELALAELKRVGAFNRSVLVLVTPTGSGWIDPGAVNTLEYLHNGDTAIAALQYSYLPSSITLFVYPELAQESSQLMFEKVYDYWTSLPKGARPRLYVHGVSLGVLGSERSAQLYELIEDPINGAVWAGPPFPSVIWNQVTRARNPDSPVWLPVFEDGSLVRFTGRENELDLPNASWGAMRIVYIQHPSDPVTFFSPTLWYKEPAWLEQRGPDVSPSLRWFPVVTFFQVAFDIHVATSAPPGFGHNFAPSSYIDAWVEVTQPNITETDIGRLKGLFAS